MAQPPTAKSAESPPPLLNPAKIFEAIRCQFSVARRMLDIAVPQVMLDRLGILAIVGEFGLLLAEEKFFRFFRVKLRHSAMVH
ncbi:MAG: hypothetical protein HC808_08505 [Candidatus Competibacteraceae bacterium]|nr:hypothetical protein [Candidatus Competibacteraceae bacterium]